MDGTVLRDARSSSSSPLSASSLAPSMLNPPQLLISGVYRESFRLLPLVKKLRLVCTEGLFIGVEGSSLPGLIFTPSPMGACMLFLWRG